MKLRWDRMRIYRDCILPMNLTVGSWSGNRAPAMYAALIYRTTDGGNNWVKQDIPAFDAVSQVFFANDTKGWSVGSLGTILTTES